ncbi:hypothetical protein [Chitinophaga cymbidii]|nr:hypothetical protein [Chitinophaga cymbidii]
MDQENNNIQDKNIGMDIRPPRFFSQQQYHRQQDGDNIEEGRNEVTQYQYMFNDAFESILVIRHPDNKAQKIAAITDKAEFYQKPKPAHIEISDKIQLFWIL